MLETVGGDGDDIGAVGAFVSVVDAASGGRADDAASMERGGLPATVCAQAPPRAARMADAPARLVRR